MRSFAHWTPRYILARIRVMIDHKMRPRDPWLTREAIRLLERLLRPTDKALEYGSGRSTLWFAKHVGDITSVEHNGDWRQRVKAMVEAEGAKNVDLRHCPRDVDESDGANSAYARIVEEFPDASLDFVLVDGIYRGHCALGAISKVKPGGLIVVDNAEWFLPSPSNSPGKRSPDAGPSDDVWRQFAKQTDDWRRIWTTNGVWDTLLLFKP